MGRSLGTRLVHILFVGMNASSPIPVARVEERRTEGELREGEEEGKGEGWIGSRKERRK